VRDVRDGDTEFNHEDARARCDIEEMRQSMHPLIGQP
jgi:hypothetical protein